MSSTIDRLHSFGQSIWYDNIQRNMLEDGDLEALIRRGDIRGMTSNPSIFHQAIARSAGRDHYATALITMSWAGWDAGQILDRLIYEDIRMAADLFLPLYRETNGNDGYVSVEVNPALAQDSAGTLVEARRLWEWIDRPNLMVKIPATQAGLPAIRQAIAEGINVNITLIFSIARYLEVINAYMDGLEERLRGGLPIDNISSVASFFVSRMDTKVDSQLEEIMRQEGLNAGQAKQALGKTAVANAKLAYAEFLRLFSSDRFLRLKVHGARLQRPLWASTSTKNPAYPDTKYVDDLIGPDTVNTMPPHTLDAFRDHGVTGNSLESGLEEARQVLQEVETLGISVDKVTQELETEGVGAFLDAFLALLKTVEERRRDTVAGLGSLAGPVAERIKQLDQESAVARMWAKDPTLWTGDPASQGEIRKRLGWLTLPDLSRPLLPQLDVFASELRAEGYTHILLLGMGGSSLAPEVMRLFITSGMAGLDLAILDSTDPTQVTAAARRAPVKRTVYIVASKSGGTAEINAQFDYFWERSRRAVGNRCADHFIAITDPGTSLEKLAHEKKFRRVFLAEPSVGGRNSALSAFGMVPAALMGLDTGRLLDRAAWMSSQCEPRIPSARNPGLVLGAILGEAAIQGRDKLTLITDDNLAPFGAWLEQLVAESSGKQGVGIVPIIDEPLVLPSHYASDRLFIYLRRTGEHDRRAKRLRKLGYPVLMIPFEEQYDLGAEFFHWEVAIAIACSVLRVNSFDQPDVQDSKERTLRKIDAFRREGMLDEGQPLWEGAGIRLYGKQIPGLVSPIHIKSLGEILNAFLAQGKPGDYVALNAYIARNPTNKVLLSRMRRAVLEHTRLATTIGFGPRFLHSTGQLHKGGKNNGLFLQLTVDPKHDLHIPTQGLTFGTLERAQALGDLEALLARDRRALRVHLADTKDLRRLLEMLSDVIC